MKKFNKKNVPIVVCSVVLIVILFLFTNKMYYYVDDFVEPVTYKIRINKITRVLHNNIYHSCSAGDCDGTTTKCSVKLTEDEYEKIMTLWDNKKALSPILEWFCEDTKVLYDSFKESHYDSIEDYNKADLDSDGKISHREIANEDLNMVINGIWENY